jgi:hypothetical protein
MSAAKQLALESLSPAELDQRAAAAVTSYGSARADTTAAQNAERSIGSANWRPLAMKPARAKSIPRRFSAAARNASTRTS